VQPAAAASAEPHPMRNVLTNVLGARDSTDIHIQERPIAPGDLFLLCTDGLHGSLDDKAIQSVLTAQGTVERTAEALVRTAIERGSRDNVTALVALCAE
jgi:serine/threonine protein phosphatase PrpC